MGHNITENEELFCGNIIEAVSFDSRRVTKKHTHMGTRLEFGAVGSKS